MYPFLLHQQPTTNVDCPRSTGMEIESTGLEFHVWKSSSVESSFAYGNRVQWTRFLGVVPSQAHGCKLTKLESISTKGNQLY